MKAKRSKFSDREIIQTKSEITVSNFLIKLSACKYIYRSLETTPLTSRGEEKRREKKERSETLLLKTLAELPTYNHYAGSRRSDI